MVKDHTKPKKIMIVEDEFVVAEDLKECLEDMGYYQCSLYYYGLYLNLLNNLYRPHNVLPETGTLQWQHH